MTSEKTNITQYGDEELSLLFLNEEGLYSFMNSRNITWEEVKELAESLYTCTIEQMASLQETFEEELEE